MRNGKAIWWLILGTAGIICLWLAYLSDPDRAPWFGAGFLVAPFLATVLTMGRDLLHDRITTVSLAGLVVLLCLPWLV